MSKIIGVHTPASLKNLAINGAFDFFQRTQGNASVVSGATSNVSGYSADMWSYYSGGSNGKSYTLQRSTNVPTQAQSGFQSTYSYQFTNTVVGGFAAGDYYESFQYRMEGLDYQKIHGKLATFGFWFNPSIGGTYSFALRNSAITRSYVTTFSASAGVWQFVTITVQMDTSAGGTWAFDNTPGVYIEIGTLTGATFQTATLNSWQNGNFTNSTSSTNFIATAGSTMNIAQFSITEGPLGFGSQGFARAGNSIQQELALCQRYFEKSYVSNVATGTNILEGMTLLWTPNNGGSSNADCAIGHKFLVEKRAVPTFTTYDYGGNAGKIGLRTLAGGQTLNVTPSVVSQGSSGFYLFHTVGTANGGVEFHWTADAGL
jgi:hypothetical protein